MANGDIRYGFRWVTSEARGSAPYRDELPRRMFRWTTVVRVDMEDGRLYRLPLNVLGQFASRLLFEVWALNTRED